MIKAKAKAKGKDVGVSNKMLGAFGRNPARAANQSGKMKGGGAATKGLKISKKMG